MEDSCTAVYYASGDYFVWFFLPGSAVRVCCVHLSASLLVLLKASFPVPSVFGFLVPSTRRRARQRSRPQAPGTRLPPQTQKITCYRCPCCCRSKRCGWRGCSTPTTATTATTLGLVAEWRWRWRWRRAAFRQLWGTCGGLLLLLLGVFVSISVNPFFCTHR